MGVKQNSKSPAEGGKQGLGLQRSGPDDDAHQNGSWEKDLLIDRQKENSNGVYHWLNIRKIQRKILESFFLAKGLCPPLGLVGRKPIFP